MKTRHQYLKGECTHKEYYSQFVSEYMKQIVLSDIGKNKLIKAFNDDKNLNNISLNVWDSLAFYTCKNNYDLNIKLREAGDSYSKAGGVCIMKEAARQAINK